MTQPSAQDLTRYLAGYRGMRETARELEDSSPLYFLLWAEAEQRKITLRTNHEQIQDAVTGEN